MQRMQKTTGYRKPARRSEKLGISISIRRNRRRGIRRRKYQSAGGEKLSGVKAGGSWRKYGENMPRKSIAAAAEAEEEEISAHQSVKAVAPK